MKNLFLILLASTLAIACKNEKQNPINDGHVHGHETSDKTEIPKKEVLSPHTSAMTMIGDAHIHIDYSSPGVRDRIIFGGLVGYDKVWQSGAHMATWIETNKDLVINGIILPAGKYGFFTIPSKGDWSVIINKNWDQHGKDEYDEKDDVIRLKVTPTISENITEHLEYKVSKVSNIEGTISLAWEYVVISFNFKVNQ